MYIQQLKDDYATSLLFYVKLKRQTVREEGF